MVNINSAEELKREKFALAVDAITNVRRVFL